MPEQPCCAICGNQAEHIPDQWFPEWSCQRCGKFDFDVSVGRPKINSPDEMVRLSGWVREQNAAGVAPVRITPETARRFARARPPGLRERSSRLLASRGCDRGPRRRRGFLAGHAAPPGRGDARSGALGCH